MALNTTRSPGRDSAQPYGVGQPMVANIARRFKRLQRQSFRRFFAQLMFHSLPSNPEALLLQPSLTVSVRGTANVDRLGEWRPRRRTWQEVAKTERAKLNHDQTAVFERIADAIDNPLNADGSRKQTLFFVTGQADRKDFLFNSLISHIRSSNKTYLGTASTGIAALLLRGGRTAHSTFRIANDLTEENTPTINFESRYAEAIRNASMILIDEVSMMNKTVLHYIEKVIKSVHLEPELRDLPFAGKVIILSGDFKQLTPVVVGAGKAGEISASIRKSDLFKKFEHLRLTQNMRLDKNQASFAKWLDELGNGTNIIPNSDGCVQVPEETSVNNLNSLIDFCYPNNCLSDPVKRVDDIKGSSILCTTNNTTFKVNETLLDRLPGKARTFKSIDKPMSDPHKLAVAMALDVHARDYTTEAINSKTPVVFRRTSSN
ncbi:hypothetical protein L596_001962 [Steinernema carpocapsae]|uniref:ATP-dependent DNA helicase n=1 Tax=Steinernema carpocapsae TaxID=34508 RepID=A0A4U8UMM1_STECR|nr:hypothetical protein L596_001962 [Steinernema carpocapsae]